MKTIYLVRHAKSDRDVPDLQDIDRPLNARGYRDANTMGNLLKEKKVAPGIIISSPAIRAISTAFIFCRKLQYDASGVIIEPDLYDTSVKHYLNIIGRTDNRFKSLMLFAHNPIISDLACHLCSQFSESLPTCAVVEIQFKVDEWKSIEKSKGAIIQYGFPKNQI